MVFYSKIAKAAHTFLGASPSEERLIKWAGLPGSGAFSFAARSLWGSGRSEMNPQPNRLQEFSASPHPFSIAMKIISSLILQNKTLLQEARKNRNASATLFCCLGMNCGALLLFLLLVARIRPKPLAKEMYPVMSEAPPPRVFLIKKTTQRSAVVGERQSPGSGTVAGESQPYCGCAFKRIKLVRIGPSCERAKPNEGVSFRSCGFQLLLRREAPIRFISVG